MSCHARPRQSSGSTNTTSTQRIVNANPHTHTHQLDAPLAEHALHLPGRGLDALLVRHVQQQRHDPPVGEPFHNRRGVCLLAHARKDDEAPLGQPLRGVAADACGMGSMSSLSRPLYSSRR